LALRPEPRGPARDPSADHPGFHHPARRPLGDLGATGFIKAARDAGIPVITFDADAFGSPREPYIGIN
jgi:hypothetical protein